ncbi:pilin [Achromobacter xylosoxidans]|uniref:pilin n=1 Tax=Alcaligenes xylosoxydans xylosoxydans TaxID=85698 RepID=UPI0006C52BB9|nr:MULTISPECIES: pilin [Achromobacter]CUJ72079.1 Pilin [Achromobacter xylosoxidans]
MNYNNKDKKGFTLIELMIAVAIVGVLGAVAVPAYQDYSIRAQISEGILLAEGAKPMITEYHATHGEYPTNSAAVGYSGATGTYVSSVSIQQDGHIVATMGNEANSKLQGKKVILTPAINGGTEIILSDATFLDKILGIGSAYAADPTGWSCYSDVEPKYLPKSCEHRTISGNQPGEETPEDNFDLWGGSGQFDFKIEDDKPYRVKDFNMMSLASGGSVLDVSALANGDLSKVSFERSGSDTLLKIDGITSTITLENIDLSQADALNSEQMKMWLLQRGKLRV